MAPNPRLAFPDTLNARDLGGYTTLDGRRTRWNSFVRADNLKRLTPAGLRSVLAYGVRTVVDLRWPFELELDPNPFAVDAGPARYLHASLLGESVQTWERRVAGQAGAGYASILDHFQPEMGGLMRALAGAPDGGVLFHCHAGKDRTGVVAMVLLALAGVPAQVIVDDYAISEVNLSALHAGILAKYPEPAERARVVEELSTRPEKAAVTLDHLDRRYGGSAAYLRAIGLAQAEIEALRSRLLE